MSRRIGTAVGLLILVAAVAAGFVLRPDGSEAVETSAAARNAVVPTETVEVSRRDLTEEVKLTGTVSHGEARPLPVEAEGLVTSAPSQDDVVGPGDELIRINDRPVTLAEGSVPLYRELRRVGRFEVDEAGDKSGLQEGEDVAQLQRFLLAEGFDDEERLEADGIFGITTERAVKAWQKELGVTSLKRTTGADGSARHEVKVEFVADAPTDVETAEVVSTRILADDVTTVPVRALVALAEGGWAVQVETDAGLQLTAVELGSVVDGFAEIDGLDDGTPVVVPA